MVGCYEVCEAVELVVGAGAGVVLGVGENVDGDLVVDVEGVGVVDFVVDVDVTVVTDVGVDDVAAVVGMESCQLG